MWMGTKLGYRMPADLEIRVFNDMNGNGIQDDGEHGIPNVDVCLTADGLDLPDQLNGGNAHSVVTTDEDGIALFTKEPQNVKLRSKVTRAPPAAIPTVGNSGGDDEKDSDLRSDGTSYEFHIKQSGVHKFVNLGYQMPDTVRVRVWDDANANGIKNGAEKGIEHVHLQLVDANTRNFFPTHEEIVTDAEGWATFTQVPKGKRVRVKITEAPKGTGYMHGDLNTGRQALSDLKSDGCSKSFIVEASGSQIDLGLSYLVQ